MLDISYILLGALLGTTVVAAVEYYKRLSKAQKEYERARTMLEDIVVSFNRQFRNEATKLETLGYRVEASAAKTDSALKKAEGLDGMVRALESKVASEIELNVSTSVRLNDLQKKASDLTISQQSLDSKVAILEQQASRVKLSFEPNLEGVIPLKREKALAQLTNTELAVLEFLVNEGAKTAPEIKERVKLSREHTARLMKRLYEEGYLERETGKLPFKYNAKKEVEKLLKKTESEAT